MERELELIINMLNDGKVDLENFLYPHFIFKEGFVPEEEIFDFVNEYLDLYISGKIDQYEVGNICIDDFEEAILNYLRYGIKVLYYYGGYSFFSCNTRIVSENLFSFEMMRKIFLLFKTALFSDLEHNDAHDGFWSLCGSLLMADVFMFDPYVDTEPRYAQLFSEREVLLIKLFCSISDKAEFKSIIEKEEV